MITTKQVPQRVLMTADTVGGVWTYAVELSRALAAHGIEVGLATMGGRLNLSQQADVASLSNVKVFESAFKLEWMDEPRADIERAGHWLLELEDVFHPDVVHLNNFAHGSFPWRAPKIVVGHSCVLSWWRAVHGCDAPSEWDEYREFVMAGLHGAELVVAPSRAMLDALIDHYGPFKSSTVIYNGRALPQLQPRSKHDFIFSAGRLWDAGKNVAILADVAPKLSWPVMVAGQDTDPDGRAVPKPNISYLGALSSSEILSYFERAKIYALPARYEPFGLSALEAALAGCALVLGDIPSLREIWSDAAMFVSPDDPAALQSALQHLIDHPDETARLAERSQLAAQQYTPDKMAEGYLAAYGKILSKSISAPEFATPAWSATTENAAAVPSH